MFEGDKIDRKRGKNTDVKGDPKPNTRRHRCEAFMPRRLRQPQISTRVRRVRCVACNAWVIPIDFSLAILNVRRNLCTPENGRRTGKAG